MRHLGVGSSYAWHLAGGGWGPASALPAGSSGGLAVADRAGTFVYADSGGNAVTFAAGASGFGTGSGPRGREPGNRTRQHHHLALIPPDPGHAGRLERAQRSAVPRRDRAK